MEKRYQVFVSSTYEDLQDERKAVMQTLLEMDCIPTGMELFPASNDDQWTFIKGIIDDCDYYILIIGGRYGSIGKDGISYTEMEYQYALKTNKPVIAFLHKEPGKLAAERTEQSPEGKVKLQAFRDLAQSKLSKFWTNPDDLGGVVARSMMRLIKDYPAIGWVRADNATDEKALRDIIQLQKDNDNLRAQLMLDKTQAPPDTENLAQGEDTLIVTIELDYYNMNLTKKNYEYNCVITWNELFRAISPSMANEHSANGLKQKITNYVADKHYDEIMEKLAKLKHKNTIDVNIPTVQFQEIMIQFKALGLIVVSDKRNRSVRDKGTYWTLTSYGDYLMTKLIAKQRDKLEV